MTETIQIAHHDVWERVHGKDADDARRELVNIYARIVKYVAGRMAIGLPHYVEFNDLVSAGLLGLIQAVDKFDHTRGIKFETFAIPRIRGSILDELRSQDWFPRSLRRKAKQLEEAYATLEARLGRPATDAEVARELDIPLDEFDGMIGEVSIATIMSLDAETGDDDNATSLGEYLPDPATEDVEAVLARQEMKDLIGKRMGELPEKEQLVLVLYYYEELTLKEIGEILDVTESRVCQIHTKAILRLKSKIQRNEGKQSIGQITREIQQRQDEREKAKTPVSLAERVRDLEPVNVMAALSLFQVCSFLAWMARDGAGWPGTGA
ncbi:MAG TPA: FliA/WhiG family RNA polymerase sigma factor [Candidatus Krumholzibacteria bacterium]|nr:FliA/WhiG family RNA polymerase sigma factor [Candidatus Krumholzibacteria bacterium]